MIGINDGYFVIFNIRNNGEHLSVQRQKRKDVQNMRF